MDSQKPNQAKDMTDLQPPSAAEIRKAYLKGESAIVSLLEGWMQHWAVVMQEQETSLLGLEQRLDRLEKYVAKSDRKDEDHEDQFSDNL